MELDQFTVAIRHVGTRACFDLAEVFEADIARHADGTPLEFRISDRQTTEARAAIAILRRIVSAPDLVPNTQTLAGRLRQGIAKGRPASKAARRLY